MAVKTIFSIFTILILSFSCSKKIKNNDVPVFLSKQISSGIPDSYNGSSGLVSNLMRHQLILDSDGDGVLDKDDFDIDGDLVPNDCDLAPFDSSTGSSDLDSDGIPDFCDMNPFSHEVVNDEKANFQNTIFKEKGFIFIEDNLVISEKDLPFLSDLIEKISLKALMPSKRLYTVTLTSQLGMGEYGAYDPNWSSIRYLQDDVISADFHNIKLWKWVLTHEFFHFVALVNPSYYEIFQKKYSLELNNSTLVYPTDYSKESESEYFAEFETNLYFNN